MKTKKDARIICVFCITAVLVGLYLSLVLHSKRDMDVTDVIRVGVEYYDKDGVEGRILVDCTEEGLSSLDGYVLLGDSLISIQRASYTSIDMFQAITKGSDSDTFYVTGKLPVGTTINDNNTYTIKREDLSKDIEYMVKDSVIVRKFAKLPINPNTYYKVQVEKSSNGIFQGLICDAIYTEWEILLNDFNGQEVDAGKVWELLGHLDATKKDLAVLIHTTNMNPNLYWVYNQAIEGSISMGKTEDANSLDLVQVSLSKEQGQVRFEGELSREIGVMDTILTKYKTNDLGISETSYSAEYIYSRKTGEVIGVVLTAR